MEHSRQTSAHAVTPQAAAPSIALAFENVSLAFDDHVVLRDVSFTVPKGSMRVVLGAVRGDLYAARRSTGARTGGARLRRTRRIHRSHAGDAVRRAAPARCHRAGAGVTAQPHTA